MAHRTQLYLDDSQYHFLKDLSRSERKSIASIIRDWINERRQTRSIQNYAKDPFFKAQGLFNSKTPDMATHFDDYLYGDKK